ncbi:hypothetical protein MIN45_P1749 [Methylomarinovum tepidoasis]|uniref:Transposase n=1 Tax=Methylomarinovum tepidoasis TaxID=2840183 RepID=A0AAU9CP24_9GAMM|nr:hypothetical protein MIN45_P1749 [Methylomarinovum sp. IN45]
MAVATWILICQGVKVHEAGLRRRVDPHWRQGLSYARIGWHWTLHALGREEALLDRIFLPVTEDPDPVLTTRNRSRWGCVAAVVPLLYPQFFQCLGMKT